MLVSLMSSQASASITLPWSTTYNCPELVQGTAPWNAFPADLGCDGIESFGASTANGQGEQITTAANYSNGGGVRGQRQWNCDGSSCGSGNTQLNFTTAQPELYIRWYMRYQLGYTWANVEPIFDKVFFIRDATGNKNSIPEFHGTLNNWNMFSQVDSNHDIPAPSGWTFTQGGTTGDGQFHCYEVHIKEDTNGSNGIGEFWFEGVLKGSITNINYGTAPGWTEMEIGSNQGTVANGGVNFAVDFDDIAIRTTGPIGCLGADVTPPSAPTNLQIISSWAAVLVYLARYLAVVVGAWWLLAHLLGHKRLPTRLALEDRSTHTLEVGRDGVYRVGVKERQRNDRT